MANKIVLASAVMQENPEERLKRRESFREFSTVLSQKYGIESQSKIRVKNHIKVDLDFEALHNAKALYEGILENILSDNDIRGLLDLRLTQLQKINNIESISELEDLLNASTDEEVTLSVIVRLNGKSSVMTLSLNVVRKYREAQIALSRLKRNIEYMNKIEGTDSTEIVIDSHYLYPKVTRNLRNKYQVSIFCMFGGGTVGTLVKQRLLSYLGYLEAELGFDTSLIALSNTSFEYSFFICEERLSKVTEYLCEKDSLTDCLKFDYEQQYLMNLRISKADTDKLMHHILYSQNI